MSARQGVRGLCVKAVEVKNLHAASPSQDQIASTDCDRYPWGDPLDRPSTAPPVLVTPDDVERELLQLFRASKNSNLVVRVQGAPRSEDRQEAFRELLESLTMYGAGVAEARAIVVKLPDSGTVARALSVLSQDRLQRRLFERILATFGGKLLDPLGHILDAAPGGPLRLRMASLRADLLRGVQALQLTQETQEILNCDLRALLSDDYLSMLAEHEERVQRPRARQLVKDVLHLVGTTFQRAFRGWPENAARIAQTVCRLPDAKLELGEHPIVLRRRIVAAIADFLWIETGAELSGSLSQLFSQKSNAGLVDMPRVELDRATYSEFAEACWELVAEQC